MSTTSRGINLERKAAAYYRERGYVVASRRHFGGGGDLVAVRAAEAACPRCWGPGRITYPSPAGTNFTGTCTRCLGAGSIAAPTKVILCEVKGTARPPWQATWGPAKRQELIDDAQQAGATPVLWWKPPGGELSITGPEDWPK